MIQTILSAPPWPINEDVRYLAIRKFDAFQEVMLKPMHAKHEIHMMFMIRCKMRDFRNSLQSPDRVTLRAHRDTDCTFSGILTSMVGNIVFDGPVQLLVIHFTPTGFYRLFGISPKSITDRLGDVADVFPRDVSRLHEQLQESRSSAEIFQLTEQFLFARKAMQRPRFDCPAISKASALLLRRPGLYSISGLANHTNMTVKTFERKFNEFVGVTPKLYERLSRFGRVVEARLADENMSWTHLSQAAGYYDQTHLVKDFYSFAGTSPSAFFNHTPPPAEKIVEKVD